MLAAYCLSYVASALKLEHSFSRHQAGMHQDEAPSAAHRVQVLSHNAGRRRNSRHQVVRI